MGRVMVSNVVGAGPFMISEGQFLGVCGTQYKTTSAARLRGVVRVDRDESCTVKVGFIGQHTQERLPADIGDAHSQGVIAQHVLTPQFFGNNQIVVLDQCCRDEMQEVIMPTGDFSLNCCDDRPLFLVILGVPQALLLFQML